MAMDDLFRCLHDDIGITILSLLPQRILLKFRTVNKSWRDTIDSSILREVHVENQRINNRSYNKEDNGFLLLIQSRNTWKLTMRLYDSFKSCDDFPSYQDFFKDHMGSEFLSFSGPVHGLICLYSKISNKSVALCNPSLGKIKILPPSTISSLSCNLRYIGFGYLGFGYDDVKKDYKVVQTWFNSKHKRTEVEVYSRRDNIWRVLAVHQPLHNSILYLKPIRHLRPWISAGVVYWYGKKRQTEGSVTNVDHRLIMSFDMHSEAFKMIEIPFIQNSSKIDIVAKDDSILLFVCVTLPPFHERSGVDIWEYKREWIKMVRLIPFTEVTSLMSDGLVFKIISNRNLVIYDYGSKKKIEGIDLNNPFIHKNDERMIEYMGSFISP